MTSNPQRFDVCCLTGAWSPRPGYADSPFFHCEVFLVFLCSLLSIAITLPQVGQEYHTRLESWQRTTWYARLVSLWRFLYFCVGCFLLVCCDCLATGMARALHAIYAAFILETIQRFCVLLTLYNFNFDEYEINLTLSVHSKSMKKWPLQIQAQS